MSTPRNIIVDGKPATVVGEYIDHETNDLGFDYQFHGDNKIHWIKQGSVRLGSKGPAR